VGWLLVAATVVAPAAGSDREARAPKPAKAAAAIPDSTLGLSRASVFAVPAPPPVTPNGLAPGEGPRLARAYPGAPPLVPHLIADFLPISREANACIDCHDAAAAAQSGAVPAPASHYRDLRRAPDVARGQVAGARYVCTSCHASVTDAKPLVGNRFAR